MKPDSNIPANNPRSPVLLSLGRTEVHLWYVFPNVLTDGGLLGAYHDLMCPEERVQQQRFHFEKGRHEYLVTRALVRTTLSRYVAVDPRDWRFEKNAYGRPEIAYPRAILPLRFNPPTRVAFIACWWRWIGRSAWTWRALSGRAKLSRSPTCSSPRRKSRAPGSLYKSPKPPIL